MKNERIFSKNFSLVAIGQVISLFGNQILRYALPLYILNETGSSALFGMISASVFIPLLMLYPIGGIIADRMNKRNIMVVLDFSTAMLITLFYLLQDRFDIVPLIAITMMILYAIQGAYQPAVKASVPVLVPAHNLMRANSVVDVISSLSSMAGPVIGGILFSLIGLTSILYISAGCFLLSAIMELFIKIPYKKMETYGGILQTGMRDLKESIDLMIKKQPSLWKMSLLFSGVNLLLTSLIIVALPVLITQRLGFPIDVANRLYGYQQGFVAAGSVIGGLLAGILSKKLQPNTLPYVIIGCAVSVLVGGMALQCSHIAMLTYVILTISCSCLLIFETLFTIQILSYIQILTPRTSIGKVTSCVMCVCMCTNPIGQFLYGFVFEHSGTLSYLPFYVAGILIVIMGVSSKKVFRNIADVIKETTKQTETL